MAKPLEQATDPTLAIDDGRVILKKESPPLSSSASTEPALTPPPKQSTGSAPTGQQAKPAGEDDTTVIKVNSRYSPRGKRGQKYLAAGVSLSMRLWEEEQPGKLKSQTQRKYETAGYVISGRAELQIQGQLVLLEPGDSWIVPKGSLHRYKILEPFTAIEATCPPAEVHGRDEA